MFEAEVKEGAALLDKYEPDWFRKVDVGQLEMANCHKCVLGQYFEDVSTLGRPGYCIGLLTLGLDRLKDAPRLGFTITGEVLSDFEQSDEKTEIWSLLADAWVAEIKQRYEAALV